MASERSITIADIRDQYIMDALSGTSYRYKVFVNTGAYEKSRQSGRLRIGTINALLELTDSDVVLLGGGLKAVAMNVTLSFLLPVDDDVSTDGSYEMVENFRSELSEVFGSSKRLELKVNGKTYVGAVSAALPIGGELEQRQGIGKSIEYVCYLEFAYLENAINSSDVQFYLDDDSNPIPYTSFSFSRKPTLTANLYSSSTNGASQTFAENTVFGVDLSLPAIDPSAGGAGETIFNYVTNISNANVPHVLTIKIGGTTKQETVIFGEVSMDGSGIENASWRVSFVPYIPAEDDEEE